MIYNNDKIYQRSDTAWHDRLCGDELTRASAIQDSWVHMCVDGIPTYWERFVVKTGQ